MSVIVRPILPGEAQVAHGIMTEAAGWLVERGIGMWLEEELCPRAMAAEIAAGMFVFAEVDGEPAGIVRFQWEDAYFWPDQPVGQAAYVHRLAVRRQFAGGAVSGALLRWAAERAAGQGRRFLRLDCDLDRRRLRDFYESQGFAYHSDRRVGPHHVARYQKWVGGGGEVRTLSGEG